MITDADRYWQSDLTRRSILGGLLMGAAATLMMVVYAAMVRPIAVIPGALYQMGFVLVLWLGGPDQELLLMAAFAWSQAMIAIVLLLVDGGQTPLICLLFLGVAIGSSGNVRRVATVTVLTVASIIVVLVGQSPAGVAHRPVMLPAALLLALTLAAAGRASARLGQAYAQSAVVDSLTGMLNRATLPARAAELTKHAEANGRAVALLVADIDHFKTVNDARGHAVGDRVLADVAHRLRMRLRAFDLAYRLGGEEFLVLVPDAGAVQATLLAQRLVDDVREHPCGGVPVTISIGVAVSPPGGFVLEALLEEADDALYHAKRGGRDRVELAGAAPNSPVPSRAAQRSPWAPSEVRSAATS